MQLRTVVSSLVLAVFVLLSFVERPATAGALEDGQAALDRGDYSTALSILSSLANQGDPGAQSRLGAMYSDGIGVPKSEATAAEWYLKAAEQGDVFAQSKLGAAYARGLGVPLDYVRAFMWLDVAFKNPTNNSDEIREACVQLREALAGLMTSDQIKEGQRLSNQYTEARTATDTSDGTPPSVEQNTGVTEADHASWWVLSRGSKPCANDLSPAAIYETLTQTGSTPTLYERDGVVFVVATIDGTEFIWQFFRASSACFAAAEARMKAETRRMFPNGRDLSEQEQKALEQYK